MLENLCVIELGIRCFVWLELGIRCLVWLSQAHFIQPTELMNIAVPIHSVSYSLNLI
jgi:hypothetical protein